MVNASPCGPVITNELGSAAVGGVPDVEGRVVTEPMNSSICAQVSVRATALTSNVGSIVPVGTPPLVSIDCLRSRSMRRPTGTPPVWLTVREWGSVMLTLDVDSVAVSLFIVGGVPGLR